MVTLQPFSLGTQDQQLIQGCVAGKRDCQESLYRIYSPRMFAICMRYASDYHTAEDILQEGFIKVFSNIDRYRSEGSFEGWMKRIFINTAIEHYRKQFRFDGSNEIPASAGEIPDDAYNMLSAKELLELVQNLSPGYRTVFNMYVVEGFSHKEIAENLQISEGTSKSQLARARSILQKMINGLT